ncbi:DUF732 domain-containing protein [Mycolicibacillus parakoreensis]|uniref:DUF732 domain-containing protein n=2 Tax=Mycolicibacillus parakoreensis TaxID=1069221 RepID=A0ABY3U1H8_9MYCO|nr:DUF732 domain-containing protein [Mycolicibacillus parakoreensis]MCV7315316.1 DUF732 domain-containing protein [Mycolicibacillus parakoreensis]ULN53357.1 DUF732 domain-containing protein [Mycolicibacillus parakoreensis]
MRGMRATVFAALAALPVALAVPAHADDVDSEFNRQLQTYGIYAPKDKNAYLAKITCHRLGTHLDANAAESIGFLSKNLDRHSTEAQKWQFLGTSITTYCPDLSYVVEQAAAQH